MHIVGHGINFFHIENWYSIHSVIPNTLKLTGLYWRGRRNAENIQVRHHHVRRPGLPMAFDGFTILHLSDMHVDISQAAMQRLIDFFPASATTSASLRVTSEEKRSGLSTLLLKAWRAWRTSRIRYTVSWEITIRSAWSPAWKKWASECCSTEPRRSFAGISASIWRGSTTPTTIASKIEKAASQYPHDEFSILLSHTPEIYRQAAHADFNLLLSGHTHGGQIVSQFHSDQFGFCVAEAHGLRTMEVS